MVLNETTLSKSSVQNVYSVLTRLYCATSTVHVDKQISQPRITISLLLLSSVEPCFATLSEPSPIRLSSTIDANSRSLRQCFLVVIVIRSSTYMRTNPKAIAVITETTTIDIMLNANPIGPHPKLQCSEQYTKPEGALLVIHCTFFGSNEHCGYAASTSAFNATTSS